MKTEGKIFVAVIGLAILCAWALNQTKDIDKAEWLIGTWENKTPRGSIYETWNKMNENEYSGKSYVVMEQDTIVFETIRLVQEQSGLFYIPTVRNPTACRSVLQLNSFQNRNWYLKIPITIFRKSLPIQKSAQTLW